MTSLPFPSFVNKMPVDASDNRAALSAAGRCRFAPATVVGKHLEDFEAICAKNKEQALVDTDTPETKDENKKLKKKYMKQGAAMASKYLLETLQLDVSIVLVEIVVDSKDIVGTDGCLAACLLDAGCAAVVIDGTDTAAMDAAKIPRERIVAHFADEGAATAEAVEAALKLAGTISVGLLSSKNEVVEVVVDRILTLVPEKSDKVSFQLAPGLSQEDLESTVAQVSKKCKDGKGSIALVDPSATQLGLSFTACMRTDRDDGLFTTVVCTRSGEALGLVYSSKVRQQCIDQWSLFRFNALLISGPRTIGIGCRCP
jgi:hypothetical protein